MTKTSEDLLKAFGGLIQKRPFMGAVASSLRLVIDSASQIN
jgi:hypothetical protein